MSVSPALPVCWSRSVRRLLSMRVCSCTNVRVRSYGPAQEQITLLYAHLSGNEVPTGTLVSRGDLIGWAGLTRTATSPRLHWGLRVEGTQVPAMSNWLNLRPYLDVRPQEHQKDP